MPATIFAISSILAIVVGLLILLWPKTIRIALGFYLILIGLISLIN